MGFKTITIKEDVYKELLKVKGEEESFSEFFDKLVKKKKPDLMKFAGTWKMSNAEWKRIERKMKKRRELAGKNYRERLERMFR